MEKKTYMLASLIIIIARVLSLLVIAHVILSYFMDPYHPIREAIDRIVNPLLNPIRRYVPPVGGLDFSSFILLILIQVVQALLLSIL